MLPHRLREHTSEGGRVLQIAPSGDPGPRAMQAAFVQIADTFVTLTARTASLVGVHTQSTTAGCCVRGGVAQPLKTPVISSQLGRRSLLLPTGTPATEVCTYWPRISHT